MQVEYLGRTVFDKAGALFFSLVKNHCLADGNKWLSLNSLVVFMTLNEYVFFVDRDEAVNFTVKLASRSDLSAKEVSSWIRNHSIKVDRYISKSSEDTTQWLGVLEGSLAYTGRLMAILEEVLLGDGDG